MSAHTPGPWVVEPGASDYDTAIHAQNHGSVCVMNRRWANQPASDQQEANARLIAAAPDLLEALQMAPKWVHPDNPNDNVQPCICSQCEFAKAANAVIAKATGKEPS